MMKPLKKFEVEDSEERDDGAAEKRTFVTESMRIEVQRF